VLTLRAATISSDSEPAGPPGPDGRAVARWRFALVNTGTAPVSVRVRRLLVPAQRLAETPPPVVVPARSTVLVPLQLSLACGQLPSASTPPSVRAGAGGVGAGGADHGTVVHGSGDAVDVAVTVPGGSRTARLPLEAGPGTSVAGALGDACHPRLGPAALTSAWTALPDGRVRVVVDTTSATSPSSLQVRGSAGLVVTSDVPLPVTVLTGRTFTLTLSLAVDCAALGDPRSAAVELVDQDGTGGVAAALPDTTGTGRASWVARQVALRCG
jgi:hypothetical protein